MKHLNTFPIHISSVTFLKSIIFIIKKKSYSFYLKVGKKCMGLGDRPLSSAEQNPIEQSSTTRDSTLVEEQGQIEQSTVTGNPALAEAQGQTEQSTVTGDPALGEQSQITIIIDPASGAAHCQTEQSTVTGNPTLAEEQGQIEQSTVTGDSTSGEGQASGGTGNHLL